MFVVLLLATNTNYCHWQLVRVTFLCAILYNLGGRLSSGGQVNSSATLPSNNFHPTWNYNGSSVTIYHTPLVGFRRHSVWEIFDFEPHLPLALTRPGARCWWRSWLRHCATSRKVAGPIPDGVTGIFHWHNPPGRTMALGSTQPLTEVSTRNISWG